MHLSFPLPPLYLCLLRCSSGSVKEKRSQTPQQNYSRTRSHRDPTDHRVRAHFSSSYWAGNRIDDCRPIRGRETGLCLHLSYPTPLLYLCAGAVFFGVRKRKREPEPPSRIIPKPGRIEIPRSTASEHISRAPIGRETGLTIAAQSEVERPDYVYIFLTQPLFSISVRVRCSSGSVKGKENPNPPAESFPNQAA